jgi:FKBP-type peptidyl-prolyl cis-trans isomerase 2
MNIVYEGKNAGKKVRTHYRGTLNDGTVFDSSYDRNEPLEFICGVGSMIEGFDKAVANMEVGEKVSVHLMPEEAYGERDEELVMTVPIAQVPGAEELEVGNQVLLTNPAGMQFPVTVVGKTDTDITFDANHEMAGKELNFEIELLSVEDAEE